MRLFNTKGLYTISLGLCVVLALVACRNRPGKPVGAVGVLGGGNAGDPSAEDIKNGAFPVATSLTSFEEHLYGPLIESNCTGCHHPHETIEESHTYMVEKYIDPTKDSAKILFEAPQESAILKRVAANHNCGGENCTKDFVAEAIANWIKDLEDAGWDIPKPTYPNQTGEIAFNSGSNSVLSVDTANYLAQPAAMATGTNAYQTMMTDDPDGPIESYMTAPPGAQPRNANDATAGTATFNLNAEAPGNYFIWLRVKAPSDNENEFFINVNNQQFTMAADSTGDAWKWRQLVDEDGVPVVANIAAAGPVTATVREREGGAKFNYIAITPREDANLEQFVTVYYDLEVDVSKQAGTNAKIIATVWEKAQEEGTHKSVGVTELRMISDVPLRVKNIKPLINGIYSESHATYTFVDTVAGGSDVREDQIIQTGGATGTTWLADFSKDKLSFSFEVIKPE